MLYQFKSIVSFYWLALPKKWCVHCTSVVLLAVYRHVDFFSKVVRNSVDGKSHANLNTYSLPFFTDSVHQVKVRYFSLRSVKEENKKNYLVQQVQVWYFLSLGFILGFIKDCNRCAHCATKTDAKHHSHPPLLLWNRETFSHDIFFSVEHSRGKNMLIFTARTV